MNDAHSEQLLSTDEIPAKSDPFQSIRTHSLVTGIVAQELFDSHLSAGTGARLMEALQLKPPEARAFIGYLCSMHDIGKLGLAFMTNMAPHLDSATVAVLRSRGLIAPSRLDPVRHELTSKNILKKKLWVDAVRHDGRSLTLFANVIGAHHQGSAGKHDYASGSPWAPYWTVLDQEMQSAFLDGPLQLPEADPDEAAFLGVILNGLLVMSDWIASGAAFNDAQTVLQEPDGREVIRNRAATFVKDSRLAAQSIDVGSTFDSVWPQYAGNARPLQTLTEEIFRDSDERASLLLIEAPMGEGKTEAALLAASQMMKQWNKSGVYFALPTAATANQMIGRVRSFLSGIGAEADVRLLHGTAWLFDGPQQDFNLDDAVRIATEWLKPTRRALLGSWAVGTVDQAMMAAMFIRYGVLRLLGLTGKVLVLDEVHAYDVYMSDILRNLLVWAKALDIPVVLLSATLPTEKRRELLSAYGLEETASVYPGITCVTESGKASTYPIADTTARDPVSVRLHSCLHETEKMAQLALELAQDGGSVGVLVNTVAEAQAVYEEIVRRRGGADDVLLFHSRFLADRRREIERQCVEQFGPDPHKRADGAILVCTQVAEQSLDIDLDALVTAAAPMDLLLQRLGRMHRHRSTKRPDALAAPVLHVLVPPEDDWGSDGLVYPPCLLRQTRRILEATEQIVLPDDIPRLVEAGYDPGLAPPEEMTEWFQRAVVGDLERAQSRVVELEPPERGFEPVSRSRTPDYDDLEDHGYLSAVTRLSSPTIRIALLEPELYEEVVKTAGKGGEAKVFSQDLGRRIMEKAVSIPASKLHTVPPLKGAGLVQNVDIYPVEKGVYDENGTRIIADDKLGVKIQQNDGKN